MPKRAQFSMGAWVVGFALFCPVALIVVTVTTQSRVRPVSRVVVIGGTFIHSTGADPLADSVVILEGGRILAVGPRSEINILQDAWVVDARGKRIIPGLIDGHVHFNQSGGLYTRPDVIDLRQRVSYEQELAGIRERLVKFNEKRTVRGIDPPA